MYQRVVIFLQKLQSIRILLKSNYMQIGFESLQAVILLDDLVSLHVVFHDRRYAGRSVQDDALARMRFYCGQQINKIWLYDLE